MASAAVLVVLLVAGAGILIRSAVLTPERKSQSSSAAAPAWARNCLSERDGDPNDQYDGLTVSAAVEHSHQLDQSLILGARDGHCVYRSMVFVPHQVVVAVSKGRVVFARGPASEGS
jgi:hypothetical protein